MYRLPHMHGCMPNGRNQCNCRREMLHRTIKMCFVWNMLIYVPRRGNKTRTIKNKKIARMGDFLFPPNSVGNHGGNLVAQVRIIKKLFSHLGRCFVCFIFKMRDVFLYRDRFNPPFV